MVRPRLPRRRETTHRDEWDRALPPDRLFASELRVRRARGRQSREKEYGRCTGPVLATREVDRVCGLARVWPADRAGREQASRAHHLHVADARPASGGCPAVQVRCSDEHITAVWPMVAVLIHEAILGNPFHFEEPDRPRRRLRAVRCSPQRDSALCGSPTRSSRGRAAPAGPARHAARDRAVQTRRSPQRSRWVGGRLGGGASCRRRSQRRPSWPARPPARR